MKLENSVDLINRIDDAELVLVGLGEEWQVTIDDILTDDECRTYFEQMEKLNASDEYFPIIMKHYVDRCIPERLRIAYQNLKNLIANKNYYILSTNLDSYLEKMEFDAKKYVCPCGNLSKIQCDCGCDLQIVDFETIGLTTKDILDKICSSNEIPELRCKKCGAKYTFNNVFASKYLEAGYLEDWKKYMLWLQGTVNKKLVLLELGVGLQFPSVIRWPFEKTAMYNQKASLFRIHEKLAMLTPETAERGFSKEQNSVEFLTTCKNGSNSL